MNGCTVRSAVDEELPDGWVHNGIMTKLKFLIKLLLSYTLMGFARKPRQIRSYDEKNNSLDE